ncbi:MAG: hypothetical protein DRJ05_08155, partial [Bacteroidetes bacterium]
MDLFLSFSNNQIMKQTDFLKSLILISILSFSLFASSQDKQLTLEDAVYMNPKVLPARMAQLKWMGNGNKFSYVANNTLISGNATSKERDSIVKLDDFNAGFSDLQLDSMKRFPTITYISDYKFRFTHKTDLFEFDITSKNLDLINSFEKTAKNKDIEKKTGNVAYTIKNNLYVAAHKEHIKVTHDKDAGIVNGQTVHRNEFGISKGTFWSPKGN